MDTVTALPRPAPLLAWARPLAGVTILLVLLWRLGTGPFVAGLRLIDGWSVLAAVAIGALTAVCSAWRWSLVAGSLGLDLPLRVAVADCYRSVFLNATLPGGVLGDVHRAVASGRDAGDVGRGVRAVVWERTAGQVVQLGIALALLAALPSPARPYLPVVAAVGGPAALVLAVLTRRRWLVFRGVGSRVVLASAVGVGCHLATFLVAARVAGAGAGPVRLLPLALLALLAMGVPLTVGGFGPREGVAAWAFSAAGLTAAAGVSTAVVYGALVLVASLPGAGVLLLRRSRA